MEYAKTRNNRPSAVAINSIAKSFINVKQTFFAFTEISCFLQYFKAMFYPASVSSFVWTVKDDQPFFPTHCPCWGKYEIRGSKGILPTKARSCWWQGFFPPYFILVAWKSQMRNAQAKSRYGTCYFLGQTHAARLFPLHSGSIPLPEKTRYHGGTST